MTVVRMQFSEAIDHAISGAMSSDDRVLLFGEDVRMLHAPLFARFGPERVLDAPISEAGFVGAAVGAAMMGLRPVVEVMLVDFVPVALSAIIQEMAKVEAFSGGRWKVPLVLKASCGGGYGDGGQHEQCLWGLLAGIPGLSVVVPSNPLDAHGLMTTAIAADGPVIFLEHKLLSETWLEYMGRFGRQNMTFDVPAAGREAEMPDRIEPVPLGRAKVMRDGAHVTLLSVGVGVHRCLEASDELASRGIAAGVVDLRSVAPLDDDVVALMAEQTGRVVVVDEDYEGFGLTGEIAARLLEWDDVVRFRRVATRTTIPFARAREDDTLPNVKRIIAAVDEIVGA